MCFSQLTCEAGGGGGLEGWGGGGGHTPLVIAANLSLKNLYFSAWDFVGRMYWLPVWKVQRLHW